MNDRQRPLPAGWSLMPVTRKLQVCFAISLLGLPLFSAPAAPAGDPLHRENPRSAVTGFLEACHENDYGKGSQYLDLSRIPPKQRDQQGPVVAKDLEQVLNAAAGFDVLRLSQDPQGDFSDDPDPNIERVTTVTANEQKFTLELHRNQPVKGPAVWLFSAQTVEKLPELVPIPTAAAKIEARLPRVLAAVRVLDTPLWKWIALLAAALILSAFFWLVLRLALKLLGSRPLSSRGTAWLPWLQPILAPVLVLVAIMVFRLFEELVDPSALARLFIGRALLLVVVASFAWGLANIVDFLIVRLDRALSHRQRVVSTSVIYLGRRTAKALIVICAAILILDNWGFNMTTIIAGLGVGGIAIALAAQQTIANVFGGISVIGDAPVAVGDFGNFGGVMGTVEGIGMRSVRVRTLNRTTVSIPNSSFAGMNLENYAVRDKILFNPTLAVKRATPRDKLRGLMQELQRMLEGTKQVEIGPSPVRISAYNASSFTLELFAYVQTTDIDEYYKHQAELFLAIDEVIQQSGVELA